MKLIILTPSICRPELHNKIFPLIIKSIENSKYLEKVIHIINIDNCHGKIKNSQKETKENFIDLYKNTKVELYFNLTKESCFFGAVKNLVNMSIEHLTEDTIIFFLEDDWKLIKNFDIDNIIQNYYDKNYYIGLAKNCDDIIKIKTLKLKFKPCLWGIDLYKEIFIPAILTQNKKLDPEVTLLSYIKQYSKDNNNILFNGYASYYFIDVGRNWQKNNKKKRWNRWNTSKKNITYI